MGTNCRGREVMFPQHFCFSDSVVLSLGVPNHNKSSLVSTSSIKHVALNKDHIFFPGNTWHEFMKILDKVHPLCKIVIHFCYAKTV